MKIRSVTKRANELKKYSLMPDGVFLFSTENKPRKSKFGEDFYILGFLVQQEINPARKNVIETSEV